MNRKHRQTDHIENTTVKSIQPSQSETIPQADGVFPLSHAQQRLWSMGQYLPNHARYNCFVSFELKGELHYHAIYQACTNLIQRHVSCRTSFITRDGEPCQQVWHDLSQPFSLPIDNLEKADEKAISTMVRREALTPFNLSCAPLLRARLLALDSRHHLLLLTIHCLVCDIRSFNLILQELNYHYAATIQGEKFSTVVPRIIDYTDYIMWEKTATYQQHISTCIPAYLAQLADSQPLQLSFRQSCKDNDSQQSRRILFTLEKKVLKKLREKSIKSNTSLFAILYSAFSVLLARYSEQNDILLATTCDGRIEPVLESIIGYFANLVLLRSQVLDEATFDNLLEQNSEIIKNADNPYQHVPFEQIISDLNTGTDEENHFYKALFIFQHYDASTLLCQGSEVTQVYVDNYSMLGTDVETEKFEFAFYLKEYHDELNGLIEYKANLFSEVAINEFIHQFQVMLTKLLDDPDTLVWAIPFAKKLETKKTPIRATTSA